MDLPADVAGDVAAALYEQNRQFAELVRGADPATPVPTCPGWSLTQLLRHVGRGDRWAATIVRERADHYLDPKSVPGGKPPADLDGTLAWLTESPRTLVEAVRAVGEATPVWTFLGPRPAGWWPRRRLHETAVHRADAAFALGLDYQLPAELAADGLSEWLDLVAGGRAGAASPLDPGVTLHLHATDEGLGGVGEWLIRGTDGGIVWNHGHGKGAAAVRGRAVDLLLATLSRLPADAPGLEVLGDAAVWTGWLERTPF